MLTQQDDITSIEHVSCCCNSTSDCCTTHSLQGKAHPLKSLRSSFSVGSCCKASRLQNRDSNGFAAAQSNMREDLLLSRSGHRLPRHHYCRICRPSKQLIEVSKQLHVRICAAKRPCARSSQPHNLVTTLVCWPTMNARESRAGANEVNEGDDFNQTNLPAHYLEAATRTFTEMLATVMKKDRTIITMMVDTTTTTERMQLCVKMSMQA